MSEGSTIQPMPKCYKTAYLLCYQPIPTYLSIIGDPSYSNAEFIFGIFMSKEEAEEYSKKPDVTKELAASSIKIRPIVWGLS